MKYIKSPINYIGNKYKLISQIEPLFPRKINKFIDVFGGSGTVLINGVHIAVCATCEYIKFIKERGKVIELIGKPLKYCPECGEELR